MPDNKKDANNQSNKVVFYDPLKSKEKSDETYHRVPPPKKSVYISSKKHTLTRQHLIFNIIGIVLSILLISSGSLCIVAYSYFNRINFENITEESETSYDKNRQINDEKVNAYNGTLLNDPMILNIMLFGADTRKGQSSGQSDTMILFSIDTRHKKLKMLSIMRDTYVEVPGHENNKINSSFFYGGASLAVQAVQRNYGIKIDRYAVVDFKSFRSIIDTLGGIDVELRDEEIDYINWQCWVNGQVDTRDELDISSFDFYENEEGDYVAKVHLNGRQALWHARNRGQEGICSGDDYTRTQRQRTVMSILINRLKQADLATVMSIIYEIGPMITTNLKTSEITNLATNITTYLKYDIIAQSAPEYSSFGVDFYYDSLLINGDYLECIVIYDWNSFRRKVAEFVFEEVAA